MLKRLLLLFPLALLISFLVHGAALAQVLHVEVDPPEAVAGTEVTVYGTGFQPGEQVEVFFGGFVYTQSGTLFADDEGEFALTFTLDSAIPPGDHPLEVSGGMGSFVTIDYTILPPPPTPTPTPTPAAASVDPPQAMAGAEVTVSGTGFQPGEQIQISFAGVTYPQSGTLFAGDGGDFSINITLSNGVTPGDHPLTVTGSLGSVVNTEYTVQPPPATPTPTPLPLSVAVNPGEATAGSEVTVSGSGFQPGEQIEVSFAGATYPQSGTLFADDNGLFLIRVTLDPRIPAGSHPLHITGSQGSFASIGYTVLEPLPSPTPAPVPTSTPAPASVTVTPSAATAGAEITVSGTGFQPGEQVRIFFAGTTYPQSGQLFADDSGAFSVGIRLDALVPPGSHPLDITGSSGSLVTVDYMVLVAQPTPTPTALSASVPDTVAAGSETGSGASDITGTTAGTATETPSSSVTTPAQADLPLGFPLWVYILIALVLLTTLIGGGYVVIGRRPDGTSTTGDSSEPDDSQADGGPIVIGPTMVRIAVDGGGTGTRVRKPPTSPEDDGDDPRDTPPYVIYGEEIDVDVEVEIIGCSAIRRDQTQEYRAEAVPPGGSYQWFLSDEDIAEFDGPDTGQTVKVKGKDIGEVTLTVLYSSPSGGARDEAAVSVIYHKFTERDQPKSEIVAVPLIQPSPLVRINTQQVTHELAEDGIEIDRHRAKFLLQFRGELKDSLIDITGVEVLAGRDFKAALSKSGNEYGTYSDDNFEAKNIEVYGPGRTYVRVKASNNIGFWGADTLEVLIRISESWERIISQIEATLALDRAHGRSEAVIRDQEERLKRAWEGALESAEVETVGLVHLRNSVSRAPQNEKWSIAVEADKPTATMEVKTSVDSHNVSVTEVEDKLLAPDTEPKNYFAIHADYASERLKWDPDGKLLAWPGEPVELTFENSPCCVHEAPAVGVLIEPKPGVKLLKPKEPLVLHGKGMPASFGGQMGVYTWSVDAHPEGAEFKFEPEGPTTATSVNFFTDTPGIYTFKVDYALAGASSPWTYAVADAQIAFNVETAQTIDRIGPYGEELADHKSRPYYRERTVAVQPGAEVLVREKDGGSLGQDLDVTVLCPQELTLSTDLKARAFFPDGEQRDFPVHIDGEHPFKGDLKLRSPRPLDRLLIMGIRYGNLPRNKGDAVWIDVRVKTVPPPVADLDASAGMPADSANDADSDTFSNTVAVVVKEDENISVVNEEQGEEAHPLVNLLLRTRDLGDVDAGQGMVGLGGIGAHVNITNGNQLFEIPLFESYGMGLSLNPGLFYNSKAATLYEAVQEYRELNSKTVEQIEAEFGKPRMGPGWSISTDIGLFEYVDVDENFDNPVLTRCVEIRLPDSNRILFEEVSPRTYHVRSDAESIGEDPDSAQGFVLTKIEDDKWQLEDLAETRWIFNEDGTVIEQNNARTRAQGRQLKPMKWSWSEEHYSVTDSAERTTKFNLDSEGFLSSIEAPDGTVIEIAHDGGRITALTFPEGAVWSFEYGEHSLMSQVVPPVGHSQRFNHYLGGETEMVPEQVARDFWGRAAVIEFGDRRYSIRYSERNDEEQTVTCVAPGDHEWRYRYAAERQAVDSIEYKNAGAPDEWQHFARYSYSGKSKYLTAFEDQSFNRTSYNRAISDIHGKARPQTSLELPGNYMQNYELDDRGLVVRHVDEEQAATEFEYYPDRQIKKITYPAVPVLTMSLQRSEAVLIEEYTYDDYGRVETHRDADGVVTRYEYGGPDDPHGTGGATAITSGNFRQEFKLDLMGRTVETTDPYGLKVVQEHDKLGRPAAVTTGTYRVEHKYDAFDRLTEESDNMGRKSAFEYDAYGDASSETNADGKTQTYRRDEAGNLTESTGFDGGTHRFNKYDALRRWHTHTLPDVARTGSDGLSTSNLPPILREFIDSASPSQAAGQPTSRVTKTVGDVVTTTHYDPRGLLVAEEVQENGTTVTTVTKYDDRGNVLEESLIDGGSPPVTMYRNEWDALGRLTASTSGGATTRYSTARDDEGIYTVELLPSQTRREGRPPAIIKRFDDNERIVKEYDGDGNVTTVYDYSDDNTQCTVKSADPSAPEGDGSLITTQVLKYNQWGKVEEQTDPRTGVTVHYRFDMAGRLEAIESPAGTTIFKYDNLDRVIETRSPIPAAQGGVSVGAGPNVMLPASSITQLVTTNGYDAAGRLTRTGSQFTTEEYSYDALGRLTGLKRSGLGGGKTLSEQLFYNARGEQVGRWFSPGNYVRYSFSNRGRDMTESWHWGGLEGRSSSFSHDSLGNLVSYQTDTHPFRFEMSYDTAGRRTGYRVRNNGTVVADTTVDYGRGVVPDRFRQSYGGTSRATEFRYDSSMRVTGVTDSVIGYGEEYQFKYNRAGLMSRQKRPANDKAETGYSYLPTGAVHRVRHTLGEGWQDTLLTTFDPACYDNKGNPGAVRHVYSQGGAEKSVPEFLESEEHTFDDANRLMSSRLIGKRAGVYYRTLGEWGSYVKFLFPTMTALISAVYDNTEDTRAEVKVDYSFDASHRRTLVLTTLTPDLARPNEKQHLVHHFRYGSGQAVEEEVQEWYDVGQSVPRYIRKKYLYDEHGRRTHEIETITGSSSGAAAWARMTRFLYDFGHKPHTVRVFEKREGRIYLLSATYSVYDMEEKLVYTKHETYGEPTSGDDDYTSHLAGTFAESSDFEAPVGELELKRAVEMHYVYAGNQLIALLDGNGNVLEEYLNGPGINSRLAVHRKTGITGGWQTADYYNDYEGTSLLQTDNEGEVVQHFPQTGTYGESVKQVPEAVHASMWPSLSGLFESPARNYDARSGQFTAPDPIGLMGGINLYSFANCNPVSFKDASGNIAETAWDVASIGVGFWSFYHNVSEGRFGDAVLDAVGIGVDAVAAAIPFIPGGAGMFLKGYRAADAALEMAEAARTVDKLVPDGVGANTARAMRSPDGPRIQVLEGAGVRVQSAAARVRQIRSGVSTSVVAGGGRRVVDAATKLKGIRRDAIAQAKSVRRHVERLMSHKAKSYNGEIVWRLIRARRHYYNGNKSAAGTLFHSVMFRIMRGSEASRAARSTRLLDDFPPPGLAEIPMAIDKTIDIPGLIKIGDEVIEARKGSLPRRRPDLSLGAGPIPDIKPRKSSRDYYNETDQFQDVLHATSHLPFPLYYKFRLPRGYKP